MATNVLRCRKCHKLLPEGSAFCMHCGTKVTISANKPRRHRRSNGMGSVRKLSGNRSKPWEVRAPSANGRVLIGTFSDKKDAEIALALFISNHETNRSLWTVRQFYEAWTAGDAYQSLTESTKSSHSNAWKHFAPIKDMRMSEIKKSHLQVLIDNAISAGNGRAICEKIRNLASRLCQEAMSDDVMDKNYAKLLELPKSDAETKDVFTADEIAILKAHDSDYEARLLLILIYTGMRISELLQLRNENIDTEHWFAIGGIKTEAGKNRIIPLLSNIRPYISELMSDNALLVHKDGHPMRREYFEKTIFKKYLIKLGILEKPKEGESWRLSPHSARHTLTTLSRKAGIKEDIIARVVGHTTYETTDKHYVQLDASYLVSEMEKINRVQIGDKSA